MTAPVPANIEARAQATSAITASTEPCATSVASATPNRALASATSTSPKLLSQARREWLGSSSSPVSVWRILSPVPLCILVQPRRLILLDEQVVFKHQTVHVRCHETPDRVLRRTDDRLAANVEARVDQNRTARQLVESSHQPIEPAVSLGIDGLDSRGIVHVGDGGHAGTGDGHPHPQIRILHSRTVLRREGSSPILSDGRHQQHVRTLVPRTHPEHRVSELPEDAGRERAKRLSELDLYVHHLLHAWRTSIAEDAPAPQRPRSVFHASMKPADHLLGIELLGNPGQIG